MRIIGLYREDSVTFVSSIGDRIDRGGSDTPTLQNQAYVIYDKRGLFENTSYSNGIHAFLVPPSRACLGFMSDEGYMPLPQVGAGLKPGEPQA